MSSNHRPHHDSDHLVRSGRQDPEDLAPGTLLDALLEHLPEFMPNYRDLVAACDDDPGEPVVLMELADFVAARLAMLATGRSMLERAFWVVESLIDSAADDEIGCELIGLAFFDSLSPESRRLLGPWLGPRSLELPRGIGDVTRLALPDVVRSRGQRRKTEGWDRETGSRLGLRDTAGGGSTVGCHRRLAWCFPSTASMHRDRSSLISWSVNVWSNALKRRWKARLREPSGTDGPR